MKKRIVRIHNKNLINTLTHTFWLMVVCGSCFGKWTKRIQQRINQHTRTCLLDEAWHICQSRY